MVRTWKVKTSKGKNKVEFEEIKRDEKLDLVVWRRILRFVIPYKRDAFLLILTMIIGGCIDATYTLMQKFAVDRFIMNNTTDGLVLFGAAFFVILVIQTLNTYFLIKLANTVSIMVCYDLRKVGFQHLQRLSFSYYDKTQVGWIVSRMASDTYKLASVLTWGIVDIVWAISMILFVVTYMFILNVKLALITLAVIPVLVLCTLYFQKKILKYHRVVRKTNAKITGEFNEGIMGAKTSKILGTEEMNLSGFRTVTKEMRRSSVMAAVYSSLFLPVVMTLGSIGTAMVLWTGGDGLVRAGAGMIGAISFGTLSAFLTYSMQMFEPLRDIARVIADIISTQASAERVLTLLDSKIDICDSAAVIAKYGDETAPKKENWPPLHGDIAFRDVTFSYDGRKNVLEHFNMDIKQGETIAFVGETGAGKSTIVNLVCRFYEPKDGKILIDGVDVKERSQLWLESHLGYVLQDPHLFSGSIRENIRYGKLDADNAEIEQAAKTVKIHDYILSLPDGYDTEVEEGGGRLSTGQKQLISIARAVLADPRIFVLDEATSSVDTETEKLIQEAIEHIMKDRTSMVIAHRLSTIQSADRIFVIQDGGVLEQGSHQELISKKGHYYKLYTNQFVEEKIQDSCVIV